MTQIREAWAQAPGPDIAPLLEPLEIGQLRLRNRFVLPGMQRAKVRDDRIGDIRPFRRAEIAFL